MAARCTLVNRASLAPQQDACSFSQKSRRVSMHARGPQTAQSMRFQRLRRKKNMKSGQLRTTNTEMAGRIPGESRVSKSGQSMRFHSRERKNLKHQIQHKSGLSTNKALNRMHLKACLLTRPSTLEASGSSQSPTRRVHSDASVSCPV